MTPETIETPSIVDPKPTASTGFSPEERSALFDGFQSESPVSDPSSFGAGREMGLGDYIIDGAVGIGAGAEGFVKSVGRLGDDIGELFGVDVADDATFDSTIQTETWVGGLTSGLTQFALAFLPFAGVAGAASKAAGLGRLGTAAAMGAAGAAADFVAFDEKSGRLSDLVESYPQLRSPLTAYLASDPDDSWAEGRFKNVLEGFGLGIAADGVLASVKMVLGVKKAATAAEKTAIIAEQTKVIEQSAKAVQIRDQIKAASPNVTVDQIDAQLRIGLTIAQKRGMTLDEFFAPIQSIENLEEAIAREEATAAASRQELIDRNNKSADRFRTPLPSASDVDAAFARQDAEAVRIAEANKRSGAKADAVSADDGWRTNDAARKQQLKSGEYERTRVDPASEQYQKSQVSGNSNVVDSVFQKESARNAETARKTGTIPNALPPSNAVENISLGSQAEGGPLLGDIKFLSETKVLIRLSREANIATVNHEFFHFYRRFGLSEAEQKTLADAFKVDLAAGWTRASEEAAARSFERFVYDGVAPSPEQAGHFKQMADFMRSIYKDVDSSPISAPVSPEFRAFMNELTGVEQRQAARPGVFGVGKTAQETYSKAEVDLRPLLDDADGNRLSSGSNDQGRSLPENAAGVSGSFAVDSARRGGDFHAALKAAAESHPFGKSVTVKDPGFYTDPGTKLFLSPDGKAGAAVTADGDLVSVFKDPTSLVRMDGILAEAAKVATTLDAFDIGGKLPDLYAKHGFRPAARLEFSREYAPPGWDYERMGTPDVIFMVKDPTGASGLPKIPSNAEGGYASIRDRVRAFPSDGYEEAAQLQQLAKAKAGVSTDPVRLESRSILSPKTTQKAVDDVVSYLSRSKTADELLETLGVPMIDRLLKSTVNSQSVSDLIEVTAAALSKPVNARMGGVQTLKEAEALVTALSPHVPIEEISNVISRDASTLLGKNGVNVSIRAGLADTALIALSQRILPLVESGAAWGTKSAEFGKLFETFVLIQEASAIVQKESARVPSMKRVLVKESDARAMRLSKTLTDAIEGKISGLDKQKFRAVVSMSVKDPSSMNRLVSWLDKANQGKPGKILNAYLEYWTNALISSPSTSVANFAGNLFNTVMQPLERLVGGAVSGDRAAIRSGMNLLAGHVTQIGEMARIVTAAEGLPELSIPSLAVKAFREERSLIDSAINPAQNKAITAENFGLKEGSNKAAMVDWIGRKVRLPNRINTSVDEIFKQLNTRSALLDEGYQLADSKGLTGSAKSDFASAHVMRELNAEGGVRRDSSALQYGLRASFAHESEGTLTRALQDLVNKVPMFKIVLPFVRTPMNILDQAAQYAPLGAGVLLSKQLRNEMLSGDPLRVASARGRIAVGTAFWTVAGLAASTGLITGGGPKNAEERKMLLATGWRPYSMKIAGDDGKVSYLEYRRLEPVSILFGMAADFNESIGQMRDNEVTGIGGALVTAVTNNVTNRTWLMGVSQAVAAITSPDRKAEKWLRAQLASNVPTVLARGDQDDLIREVRTHLDAIKERLPGFSSTLPPRRNILGEPIASGQFAAPFLTGTPAARVISPFGYSQSVNDAVKTELAGLQFAFNPPSRKFGDLDLVAYTKNGRDAYDHMLSLRQTMTIGGQTMAQALERLIASPAYQRLPMPSQASDESNPRVQAVQRIQSQFQRRTLMQTLADYPEIRRDEQASRASASGLPKAFLDMLP